MKQQNTDIVTKQHGYMVFARGEHRRPAKNCETCKHYSETRWNDTCLYCKWARGTGGSKDRFEIAPFKECVKCKYHDVMCSEDPCRSCVESEKAAGYPPHWTRREVAEEPFNIVKPVTEVKRHAKPVHDCETCRNRSVSYWDEPCISCCQARQVQGLEDKWESVGPSTARECAEAQILVHLKAVRDIAQEYAGKQFMTASFLSDGAVHIYNAAGYNDSGLPVIDAMLKGEE